MKYLGIDCGRGFFSAIGVAVLLTAALAFHCVTGACATEDGPPATRQTPPPDYSSYTQSYRVPFGNIRPVDFDHLQGLSVRASLNGGPPMRFQVDTGSTGVIVGAGEVPNIDPNAPAGSITYTSSGIELDGVWTPVTITFPDSNDGHGNIATAVVPVLAVSERKIHPGAVNSGTLKPMSNPKVYMFGIGSGRGKEPHQERNPWVNLKEMQAGSMRRGYAITRDGITLGLTPDAVGKGYLFEKLKEHTGLPTTAPATQPGSKDWDSSTGWITVGGAKQEEAGMLLDTGLTNLMIELPDVAVPSDVADGTEVSVNLLGGKLQYSFKVGDTANPATPRKVTYVKRAAGPLVNTGLRVLSLYDYLYDADGGYLGLKPVAKKP